MISRRTITPVYVFGLIIYTPFTGFLKVFFSKVTIKLLTYCNKPTTVDGTSTSITDLCHSLFTFYSHLPIISTLLNIACFFFFFTFSGQQTQSSYLSADWRGSGRGVWGTFGISHRIKGWSSHSPWGRGVGIFWWKILQEKARRSYWYPAW